MPWPSTPVGAGIPGDPGRIEKWSLRRSVSSEGAGSTRADSGSDRPLASATAIPYELVHGRKSADEPTAGSNPRRGCGRLFADDGRGRGGDARRPQAPSRGAVQSQLSPSTTAGSSSWWATARWWSFPAWSMLSCAHSLSSAPSRRRRRPAAKASSLRIGINLGDVIIDGDDIYGDGVNVAARLEGASPSLAGYASHRSSTRASAAGSTSRSRTAAR